MLFLLSGMFRPLKLGLDSEILDTVFLFFLVTVPSPFLLLVGQRILFSFDSTFWSFDVLLSCTFLDYILLPYFYYDVVIESAFLIAFIRNIHFSYHINEVYLSHVGCH